MTITLSSPESVNMCSTRLARIKETMESHVVNGDFSGISTLVARRGKVVHFEQVGFRDREAKLPMQEDTLFRMYSMTKPIVSTAFMMLYEQGKVDLRDPVSKFIPAFASLKVLEIEAKGKEHLVDLQQPVTIQHLLTHTSGLAYDFYQDSPVCQMYREARLGADKTTSLKDFVDKLCTFPLVFQPGTRWYYSISIDVIARLIEIIADMPLIEYLHDNFFQPLGMCDTNFALSEAKQQRLAAMYGGIDIFGSNVCFSDLLDVWQRGVNQRLDISETSPVNNSTYQRGGTGLFSTAENYYRFCQMLLNKGELDGVRILAPKTVDLMHMNHLNKNLLPIKPGDIPMPGYGFGLGSRVLLNVAESQLAGSEGEYGWAGAATTYYWVDPKEELIGIFLSQWMCNFSMIERKFQALVYQAVL